MSDLHIDFYRGDYFEYRFKILDNEGQSIQLGENDNLFLSVKREYKSSEYILQKKLGDGISWEEENNCYLVKFENEDTQNSYTGEFVFDIVIVYEGTKPETHTGTFELLSDVTRNEVERNANSTNN